MKRLSTLETLGLWARSHRWADLRRFPRTESDETFAGLKFRGRSHIVRLHNWSVGGACVDLPGDAKLSERVQLVAGTLRRRGRICWIIDGKAGIEFVD
ncbi:MAG: PilZ domain-containing protein [Proteobacteria bacterium]|nr:PilZ domain-containing protein [Pseudomonadota bacterium]